MFLLSLPPDAKEVPLTGNIEPAQSLEWVRDSLKELIADYPEVEVFNKLRDMNTASGIAISRAVKDADNKLAKVQAGHDQQLVKALQMGVAMAGWRFGEAGAGDRWTEKGKAREKFRGFGLGSYDAGDLDFALELRPIEVISEDEKADSRSKKYRAISDAKTAGIPDRMAYLEAGYSEAEVDEIEAENAKREEEAMTRALTARRTALEADAQKGLPPAPKAGEPGDEDAIDADLEA